MNFPKSYMSSRIMLMFVLICSCSYSADQELSSAAASKVSHVILTPEEFSKKKERFASIFDNCKLVARSHEKPVFPILESSDEGTIVIPIPERGAIVQARGDKKIRLETTGICECVGIAAWNLKNIGCIHWDDQTDIQDLQKFADDITNNKSLNDTAFLFVTNYLSKRLETVYQFFHDYAPTCPILLEAEHNLGGYVVLEEVPDVRLIYNQEHTGQDKHFCSQTQELKDFNEKSVSIKSHFKDGEIPYSFRATDSAERLQEYFDYLDPTATVTIIDSTVNNSYDLIPSDYWGKYYPSNKDGEPKMLWVVAQRMYNYLIVRRTINSSSELMYLYDSKESLPQ